MGEVLAMASLKVCCHAERCCYYRGGVVDCTCAHMGPYALVIRLDADGVGISPRHNIIDVMVAEAPG